MRQDRLKEQRPSRPGCADGGNSARPPDRDGRGDEADGQKSTADGRGQPSAPDERRRESELAIHMLMRLGRRVLMSIAQRRNIRGHAEMSQQELARCVYESFEE